MEKPVFIITIDTEGDNIWSKPKKITTENVHFLPRFQELCNKYAFWGTMFSTAERAR